MQYTCLQVISLFRFQFARGDVTNNIRQAVQHGEFHFMYPEPIQNIKNISDFCISDRILVYDKLGTNTNQKDCFIRKRVYAVRVVMKL